MTEFSLAPPRELIMLAGQYGSLVVSGIVFAIFVALALMHGCGKWLFPREEV